jgi:fermentation-respiration switch protein FrsA (DUF1100 family)
LASTPKWVVDRIAPRPILFITTDDDRLVPPQESEAMYARAGEPKKLAMLKGFGHRGLWRPRLSQGDGGDAGVVWDAPTGAGIAAIVTANGTSCT